ncbi:hypothetical protein ACE3NQ_29170 [Paenibacillus terreus]|uniref:Uncharacterized protein n=1 Tax=Paenibacillus terreus TaxID=1387834 RepID=A0ABV5BHN8_9BACL
MDAALIRINDDANKYSFFRLNCPSVRDADLADESPLTAEKPEITGFSG